MIGSVHCLTSIAWGVPAFALMAGVLNFRGPNFLVFFLGGGLCNLALAYYLYQKLFPKVDSSKQIQAIVPSDPYQVAFLLGGSQLALEAALSSLAYQDFLSVQGDQVCKTKVLPPHATVNGFELAVRKRVGASTSLSALKASAPTICQAQLIPSLRDLGLLAESQVAMWYPRLVCTPMPLLAIIKIFIGISRNKPVGFLVVLCIVAIVLPLLLFQRVVLSPRGKQVASELRARLGPQLPRKLSALESVADPAASHTIALAVAVLGLKTAVSSTKVAYLTDILSPPPCDTGTDGNSGCGSGCGGGGGCGGCSD